MDLCSQADGGVGVGRRLRVGRRGLHRRERILTIARWSASQSGMSGGYIRLWCRGEIRALVCLPRPENAVKYGTT